MINARLPFQKTHRHKFVGYVRLGGKMEAANRRLKQVQHIISQNGEDNWRHVLVLPDDARVSVLEPQTGSPASSSTRVAIDGKIVLDYRPLRRELALVVSAIGTPFERENPAPRYPVVELLSASDKEPVPLSFANFWAVIYTLWTLLHTQEHIPIVLSSSLPNAHELANYLLLSGLGRKSLDPSITDTIFLDRGTFWSGAGVGSAWSVERGWLSDALYAARAASFPLTQSFTRTPTVITQHPLRPPKPTPGSCIYRRYCTPVGQTLMMHAFDPYSEAHMNAFHKWQNDERVAKGWNEKGTMEHHLQYIKKVAADPAALPYVMSWDGELMGYGELVWIKVRCLV